MPRTPVAPFSSYAGALAFLGDKYRRPSPVCPANTEVRKDTYAGTIAVTLYSTDVVTFHADGATTIRSNGWWSQTTSRRISSFLPEGWAFSFRGAGHLVHLATGRGFTVGEAEGKALHLDNIPALTAAEWEVYRTLVTVDGIPSGDALALLPVLAG